MTQNSMTRKMLEDDQFDRELTRKIRSKVRKKSKDSGIYLLIYMIKNSLDTCLLGLFFVIFLEVI